MIAIIVIAFLALIGAALTIFRKQRMLPHETDNQLPQAPPFEGLFDYPEAGSLVEKPADGTNRQDLLELAKTGDLNALSLAHASHDPELYADVVNMLVASGSERQENFAALVSHIAKSSELRATRQLAQRLIETFKAAPDRRSTTAMVHIAALSDDAETYEQAIETALEAWRSEKLAGVGPEELVELFISQYWVIAPEARRGGVGFALKRRLMGIRRELATAMPVR